MDYKLCWLKGPDGMAKVSNLFKIQLLERWKNESKMMNMATQMSIEIGTERLFLTPTGLSGWFWYDCYISCRGQMPGSCG